MEDVKELFDEVATTEEVNEVDGEPIYHANEGAEDAEGDDELWEGFNENKAGGIAPVDTDKEQLKEGEGDE